jgi:hypothetical protein
MSVEDALLFEALPIFPVALPNDELRILAWLSEWPTTVQLQEDQHAAARRLERRGLIKISREKSDPVQHWPDWYAGKLPAAALSSNKGESRSPGDAGRAGLPAIQTERNDHGQPS